jgi:hypothetical protein
LHSEHSLRLLSYERQLESDCFKQSPLDTKYPVLHCEQAEFTKTRQLAAFGVGKQLFCDKKYPETHVAHLFTLNLYDWQLVTL